MEIMNKRNVLNRLEQSREQFLDILEGLPESAYLQPGVVGEWSIKDILAHLSRWEAELVKLLWQLHLGQQPSSIHFDKSLNIDAQNAAWFTEAHTRSLDRILDDFHAVRNQTILRVETFSDRELTDPKHYSILKGRILVDYIASDSYNHENEHSADIQRWLETHTFSK